MSSGNETNPFSPMPPPTTALGRYRVLSPHAGVRVSPLVLGAMSIGDRWAKYGGGGMDKEGSFKLLDAYYKAGGNFIDTANNYQEEASEKFIGEWMEARGIRDEMVIATKYTVQNKRTEDSVGIKINFGGSNVKSLRVSVEQSLQKLRTSYIDVLYVHFWDWGSSVQEVMNALHNLVVSGKVLYLGISDTPAWIVAMANQYAQDHGKTTFVIYQGRWNVLSRDFEREIIPMARHLGLALAPWDVLASGKIRTDAEEGARRKSDEHDNDPSGQGWERNENEKKMAAVLEEIATEVGSKSIQAVAIAYVLQKTPYVFPIIGGRKVEHLHANIEALGIALTKEHTKRIESVVPFDHGFPHNLVVGREDDEEVNPLMFIGGHFDRWPLQQSILPKRA
ncbi:aryl-alcohol dehydrogenase [NADP+] [Peniophora sp. CONT]|nr:aryl-alcohol dehydrogenase [NADP+] [Peniophora sp. CONT]